MKIFTLPLQIHTNFDDMIGKNAGKCLYNQRKYFNNVMQKWKPHLMPKIEATKANDECDVVSIDENFVESLSVGEKHRLENLHRKFAQCYMGSAWKDFEFIRSLKANKILMASTQNAESFNIINREIDDCVVITHSLIVSELLIEKLSSVL